LTAVGELLRNLLSESIIAILAENRPFADDVSRNPFNLRGSFQRNPRPRNGVALRLLNSGWSGSRFKALGKFQDLIDRANVGNRRVVDVRNRDKLLDLCEDLELLNGI